MRRGEAHRRGQGSGRGPAPAPQLRPGTRDPASRGPRRRGVTSGPVGQRPATWEPPSPPPAGCKPRPLRRALAPPGRPRVSTGGASAFPSFPGPAHSGGAGGGARFSASPGPPREEAAATGSGSADRAARRPCPRDRGPPRRRGAAPASGRRLGAPPRRPAGWCVPQGARGSRAWAARRGRGRRGRGSGPDSQDRARAAPLGSGPRGAGREPPRSLPAAATMSDPAPKVPDEMFREVKYYAVGDIDPQVPRRPRPPLSASPASPRSRRGRAPWRRTSGLRRLGPAEPARRAAWRLGPPCRQARGRRGRGIGDPGEGSAVLSGGDPGSGGRGPGSEGAAGPELGGEQRRERGCVGGLRDPGGRRAGGS